MNQDNVIPQSSLLQEMVKVKKLRFKDLENKKLNRPQFTQDYLSRKANFEEFKAVYEDCVNSSNQSLGRGPYAVHKTNSGSFCRFPRVNVKAPQYVETVNIELPLHYGADRAVQIIENKIKPKRAIRIPKVNREVITESSNQGCFARRIRKPKKSVTIIEPPKTIIEKPSTFIEKPSTFIEKPSTFIEKLNTIEEVTSLENNEFIMEEIRKQFKPRKIVPKKPIIAKPVKKKQQKIMTTLVTINEKLQKIQEKYLNMPKVPYKNVNDCYTQSENLEVLYENERYPQETNKVEAVVQYDLTTISDNVLSDIKMQERIREMNEMFPEFPKIEDTLRDIENHLDKIVDLEEKTNNQSRELDQEDEELKLKEEASRMWEEIRLTELLDVIEKEYPVQESNTDEFLRKREQVKDQKLRSLRQQIDDVENFCDKLSEIAHDESENNSRAITPSTPEDRYRNHPSVSNPKKKSAITDFIEGEDLQSSIKKSKYLSKEFNDLSGSTPKPMVKIFSEHKRNLWMDRMRDVRERNEDYSVESVTQMIDNLKFTLKNSIYEPASQ